MYASYLLVEQSLGHDFLQRCMIKHCLALWEHTRQMGISELTRRHLCLDLLANAQIANTLEVLTSVLDTGCSEAALGVLGHGTDHALCLLGERLLFCLWLRSDLDNLFTIWLRLTLRGIWLDEAPFAITGRLGSICDTVLGLLDRSGRCL